MPNQFSLEWIESHYKDEIKLSIKDLFDKQYKISIFSSKREKRDFKQKEFKSTYLKTKKSSFNNLNNKYTFDNFIVGSNNEFAKTASESVVK